MVERARKKAVPEKRWMGERAGWGREWEWAEEAETGLLRRSAMLDGADRTGPGVESEV